MKVNIIDFEASALKSPSYPIQVAVIKSDGSTYDAYIRPSDNWLEHYVWDPESQDIHNIPIQMLLDMGKPIETVAEELNEFINGEDVYCDGKEYDRRWAAELYTAAKHTNKNFDICDISDIIPKWHWDYFWATKDKACAYLRLKEHDALNDVKIIQLAVECCIKDSAPWK